MDERDPIRGCMLGTMVGDALGLPYEGMRPARVAALTSGGIRHRMLFGRGLVSDDTEHMLIAATAWLHAAGDEEAFARLLGRRLRLWLLAMPPATGLATLQACLRLLAGRSVHTSGVRSAGNGPLMRSVILGVLAPGEDALVRFVRISSRATHTDVRAEEGALAVALAARVSAHTQPRSAEGRARAFRDGIRRLIPAGQMSEALVCAVDSALSGEPAADFARRVCGPRGVTGFVMHTAPVAIHLWLTHGTSYQSAVTAAIRLAGDTDTLAATVGGLVGAANGPESIPRAWRQGMVDFPASLAAVEHIAQALGRANQPAASAWKSLRWLCLPLRNLLFVTVVLCHATRRTLPPYSCRNDS